MNRDLVSSRHTPEARQVRMSDVVERLAALMNEHDLQGASALMHHDYRSEQPTHPGRAFVGRAQMQANWGAMFEGIPDFHAEVIRSVQDGETTWTEWHWTGSRRDGEPFDVRGVTLFEVQHDQIVAGRLYLEDVDRDVAGIEAAVEGSRGFGRMARRADPCVGPGAP